MSNVSLPAKFSKFVFDDCKGPVHPKPTSSVKKHYLTSNYFDF